MPVERYGGRPQGGDLLLLLFIHGIQGGPLGREGLHAVSVSAKFALHERKARLERGQFGIASAIACLYWASPSTASFVEIVLAMRGGSFLWQ